jgi:hypothetical protein
MVNRKTTTQVPAWMK